MLSLPSELRFVRCGRGEKWRDTNLTRGEIHFGWAEIPYEALKRKDSTELRRLLEAAYFTKEFKRDSDRKTAIANSVRELLSALEPDRFTWLTIAHDKLWWCTAKPGFVPNAESESEGHFFARCDRPWSDTSLTGEPLVLKSLPPSVGIMNRYQGTICAPKQDASIWRAIRGEKDPALIEFESAQQNYRRALRTKIETLHYSALEKLVAMLFVKAGYSPLSPVVGGTEKDWDFQCEHPERNERVAVQVKMTASQSELADYEKRYAQDGRFNWLFFVVAKPRTNMKPGSNTTIWNSERLAELAEQRGLAEWLKLQG